MLTQNLENNVLVLAKMTNLNDLQAKVFDRPQVYKSEIYGLYFHAWTFEILTNNHSLYVIFNL